MRGQTRGKTGWFFSSVANTEEVTGIFKCIVKAQTENYDKKEFYEKYKKYLIQNKLIWRIYILKAKSLTPNDYGGTSDPYLVLKWGGTVINDSQNVIYKNNNPGFYSCFDLPAEIPGASVLTVQVWDYDGLSRDDLIGETKIDLGKKLEVINFYRGTILFCWMARAKQTWS